MDEIEEIVKITTNAFGRKDYETFSLGVGKLCDLILVAESIGTKTMIYDKLRYLALSIIEDPGASITCIEAFEKLGRTLAEQDHGLATNLVADLLGEMGSTAAEKRLTGSTNMIVKALSVVGKTAAKNLLEDAADASADALGNVGVAAAEKGLGVAVHRCANSLEEVGLAAVKNDQYHAVWGAVVALERLGQNASTNNLDKASWGVASALESISNAAVGRTSLVGPAGRAAIALGIVGRSTGEAGLHDASLMALTGLERGGMTAIKRKDKGVALNTIEALRNIEEVARKGKDLTLLVGVAVALRGLDAAVSGRELDDVTRRIKKVVHELETDDVGNYAKSLSVNFKSLDEDRLNIEPYIRGFHEQ